MAVNFTDGASKYYVMSKDEGFEPSAGDSLAVTRYSSFTRTPYPDIGAQVCFAQSTMIKPPACKVAIEDLQCGDHVLTADHDAQPIHWIGQAASFSGI